MIIDHMLINIHLWKSSFIKVCPTKGYHPFYIDDNFEHRYPLKWTLLKKHRDWTFKSLSLDNQNMVVHLLAMVSFDSQALISEFKLIIYKLWVLSCTSNMFFFFVEL